jgi:hypothetical protein
VELILDCLTAIHLRIIIAMAGSVKRGSDIASIGGRMLAKVVRKSQPTIWRRQQELVTWGWLALVFQAKGKRTEYRIVGYPIWKKSESSARPQQWHFPTRETGVTRTSRMAANQANISREEIDKILA